METFRLFIDRALTGAENMALDESLLNSVVKSSSAPCIRFYTWSPPALSLGYLQRAREEVSIEECRRNEVDLVRRLTGGKAVLHHMEITYSIVIPSNHRIISSPGVTDSYKNISQALLLGLKYMGVNAEMVPEKKAGRPGTQVCFTVPSSFEILAGGRKLIGSAQTRRDKIILQHGSLPLDWDVEKQLGVMGIPKKEWDSYATFFLRKASSLKDLLHPLPEIKELISCLIRGFEDAFSVELMPSSYTREEMVERDRLIAEKYGDERWTFLK